MDKLLLGRFVPGDSVLHRLDPRSKLLSLFLFLLIVFWANNPPTMLLLLSFVCVLVSVSGIRLYFFWTGLQSMLGIMAFTTLFQVFFTPGEEVLWQVWVLKVTLEGLQHALVILVRFVLILLFSTLLTLTTTPLSLADGIEVGLSPLRRLHVPVHEIGLMLSMSLRFVPTLMEDTTRIMNAQRARGVDFNEGNVVQKVRSVIPLLIPLFASSFKRADALATAMEARGYQGGEGRTKYRVLRWSMKDSVALAVMLLVSLALYLLKS